jgi:LuxR family quorum sensing-dependent transcriptional regulator/LuxR family quorum-sensing system transcriptional regulator CciR
MSAAADGVWLLTEFQQRPDALDFYAKLQKLTSVAACSEWFKLTVAPFAIEAFACGEVDLADRSRSVMFIAEWPREWMRFYVDSGFIERDPIFNALQVCREPFSFSDLTRDPKFSSTERAAMQLAARHGWSQGLVVPVERGGKRIGLVTLFGGGAEFDPLHRTFLCLASECLLNRVRALGCDIAYALPPAGLSLREIEAVRLVAVGYSDNEIGEELGIARSTAHKHVESARGRLKAKSRAHLAALALSLGIASSV